MRSTEFLPPLDSSTVIEGYTILDPVASLQPKLSREKRKKREKRNSSRHVIGLPIIYPSLI
jgi:hypothetical protein